MIKFVGLLFVTFLLSSCGAGGGAVSAGAIRLQAHWPDFGVDRYEPVVYPAEPVRP